MDNKVSDTAFVFNLGQIRTIFGCDLLARPNTETEALKRWRLKLIHIIRCMQSHFARH